MQPVQIRIAVGPLCVTLPGLSTPKLRESPRFSQVVVSLNGAMARMHTVHPLAFARIKKQLASKVGRDPLKAPKGALQAKLVTELVTSCLPHLKESEPGASAPASRARRA